MFELFKATSPIRFMKYSKPATWLSMLLIIGSLASLSINWIHWGLDFTGGTLIEVGTGKIDVTEIKKITE